MGYSRLGTIILVCALVFGALPASATDHGRGAGNMVVGKVKYGAGCSSNPSGPGLGFAFFNEEKEAWYRLVADFTGVKGPGTLVLCGWLKPDLTGQGAACDASGSNNGHGWMVYNNGANKVQITDLGWDQVVAGIIIAQGNAYDHGKNGKNGVIQISMTARGGLPCGTKIDGPPKSGGATTLTVDLAYNFAHLKDAAFDHSKPKDAGKGEKYTDPKQ